jgi:sugar phosphate isomerase/epimerase
MIRLGGNGLPTQTTDPVELARAHRAFGYSAAYCPRFLSTRDPASIRAFRDAFAAEDVMIAEVAAWSNLVSGDEAERRANLDFAAERLQLADEIGARCAISYTGSILPRKSAPEGSFGADHQPHPDNLTREGFERCVESARAIIDAAKPKRAKFAFEMMQFVYPDSPEATLELIRAIDRPAFAAHIDPVNIILTPRQYFDNGALIRECFALLGPHIVSCHAKDLVLRNELALHLDEVRLGLGRLDYRAYLAELDRLKGVPLLLEHLPDDQYAAARDAVVAIGAEIGVRFGSG